MYSAEVKGAVLLCLQAHFPHCYIVMLQIRQFELIHEDRQVLTRDFQIVLHVKPRLCIC